METIDKYRHSAYWYAMGFANACQGQDLSGDGAMSRMARAFGEHVAGVVEHALRYRNDWASLPVLFDGWLPQYYDELTLEVAR